MTSEVFEQLLHVSGLVVAPVQRGGGRHHGRGRRPQQRQVEALEEGVRSVASLVSPTNGVRP